jgi:hypothetical protein
MTDYENMLITKYDLLFESRLTKVETTLENMDKHVTEGFKEIKSDIRWMFGIMLGGFAGVFGLMAHGFHWF